MADMKRIVQAALQKKKSYNQDKYGVEFIRFSDESMAFKPDDTNSWSDKVRRIPSQCFLSIEFCQPLNTNLSEWTDDNRWYELELYTPCILPTLQKCWAFLEKSDDVTKHRHDYFELVYVYEGLRRMMVGSQVITLTKGSVCIFDMQCAHLDLRTQSYGIAFYLCFTCNQIGTWAFSHINAPELLTFFDHKNNSQYHSRYLLRRIKEGKKEIFLKILSDIFLNWTMVSKE